MFLTPQLELPPGGLGPPLQKGPWMSLEDICTSSKHTC